MPVLINGAFTIDFVLDTGASIVMIPVDVALTLMRVGTIDRSDIRGADQYVLADGSIVENTEINFRSLQLGSITLRNVEASSAASTRRCYWGNPRCAGWSPGAWIGAAAIWLSWRLAPARLHHRLRIVRKRQP